MTQPSVYAIRNTQNGKVYIGSTTTKLSIRWANHFLDLQSNSHRNIELQDDWNQYGKRCFRIETIENCSTVSECRTRELYWINHYRKNCYNVRMTGKSEGRRNRNHSNFERVVADVIRLAMFRNARKSD